MIPKEARPPCMGDASPMPVKPSSVWINTKALRWDGASLLSQLI